MKKLFNKALLALSLTGVLMSSCTKDFEEINKDPNTAPVELAAPSFLLTNSIESIVDRTHDVWIGQEIGSCWVQHMAKVQYTDEDRYIPRVSIINALWSSLYSASGNDIDALISAAKQQENASYEGVGTILRVYALSILTDVYGDIPYEEAWSTSADKGAISSPKYTAQADVYRGIIAELEYANSILDEDADDIGGDILFGGSITSWKKFGNSLRLRLLLRMSGKDAAFAGAEMSKMINDPATYPIIESNDEQAELQYLADAPNNHPIVENRKTRDDHRVSATLVNYALYDNADWDSRIFAYAEGVNGGYPVGLPNGLTSAKAGAFAGGGLSNTSKMGEYFTTGAPKAVLLSYSELQFIFAEAAHKGLIAGGEAAAEAYYNEGIESSYYYYEDMIHEGIAKIWGESWATFGDGEPGSDVILWHLDAFPYDGTMATIGQQKWAAMFDQGLQAWIEYRRTGYPVLTPGEDAVLDMVPQRLTYPLDEYARNSTNVQAAAGAISGGDELTSKVWWAN